MVEVTAQIRRWGRSLGVVIPKGASDKAKLKEGKKVRLIISDDQNPIRETFGIAKLKKPTKRLLREIDREGWDG